MSSVYIKKNTISPRFLKRAKEVLRIEASSIQDLTKTLNVHFLKALELLANCKGKIVVTGIGKPGLIGQKISATLASTGSPSISLHPAEALHGDLGRVTAEDVVIAISNSGESEEITRLLPFIKKMGIKLIGLTGNLKSTLAQHSDVVLNVGVKKEACSLGLAPTSSTTATLAMGDALAVCLVDIKGFRRDDYALYHPGGALGKKLLLKVDDIMRRSNQIAIVSAHMLVQEVLLHITQCRTGAAIIVDRQRKVIGIFTDGDLRRHMKKNVDLMREKISNVMTMQPCLIESGKLAEEAYRILKEKKIDEIPVVDNKKRLIGLVDVQDLLKAGIV